MSEVKEYDISNLADILKTVNNKNIDCFIKDFEEWLRLSVHLKSQMSIKLFEKMGMLKLPSSFKWKDDGKNDTTIIINKMDNGKNE